MTSPIDRLKDHVIDQFAGAAAEVVSSVAAEKTAVVVKDVVRKGCDRLLRILLKGEN